MPLPSFNRNNMKNWQDDEGLDDVCRWAKIDNLAIDTSEPGSRRATEAEPANPQSTPLPSEEARDEQPVLFECVALYSYVAGAEGELTFVEGDVIEIINNEFQWWEGRLRGNAGFVPSNYVQRKEGHLSDGATATPELTSKIDQYCFLSQSLSTSLEEEQDVQEQEQGKKETSVPLGKQEPELGHVGAESVDVGSDIENNRDPWGQDVSTTKEVKEEVKATLSLYLKYELEKAKSRRLEDDLRTAKRTLESNVETLLSTWAQCVEDQWIQFYLLKQTQKGDIKELQDKIKAIQLVYQEECKIRESCEENIKSLEFGKTTDRAEKAALQGELDQERERITASKQRYQAEHSVRVRLEEEMRRLRFECEKQRQVKDTLQGELVQERERITGSEQRHHEELRCLRLECEQERQAKDTLQGELVQERERITGSEQRYHEELRCLRLECEQERQAKETLQGELDQERERMTAERGRMDDERQNYQQRFQANELTIAHRSEELRQRDAAIEELQAENRTMQTMLDDFRRIEPRDWLIRREEVTLTEVTLGTGGWGTVKVGKFRGSKVAVKQIHELILSPHNRRLFEREMSIASRCRHPCLLQFIGATNDDGIPLFLTEILDSSLRKILSERVLNQKEIITIASDCARALNYLHLSHPSPIIHRDISSANVLLWKRDTYWRAKLSDYGAANVMRQYMTVNPGASIYAAPEASTSTQSVKVDVYSFGLLLCEMCIRELPVKEQTDEQVNLITSGVLRELVKRCIQREPEARPTMGEVITLLRRNKRRSRNAVHTLS